MNLSMELSGQDEPPTLHVLPKPFNLSFSPWDVARQNEPLNSTDA